MREHRPPPPAVETAPASPTAMRAWNGEVVQERRAFDQTRVQLAPTPDGSRNCQFYWQTTSPHAQAARWEIASIPFYLGESRFPPAGLVAYGDASVDAETPVKENFFVPVNDQGQPATEPSNAVRIDTVSLE